MVVRRLRESVVRVRFPALRPIKIYFMDLSFLKPKSSIFDYFQKLNGKLVEVGWELSRIPSSFPNKIAEHVDRMRRLEEEADVITHIIIDEINKSFVTPIDREDLHLLATRIDDVIDHAENAVSNILIYDIKESRDPLPDFCFCIYKATKEISEAVQELRNLKNTKHIINHNIEINALEAEGDRLLKIALENLFRNENDVKNILKWKDIFESFEKSLDRAEDVANVIEAIIIKNT